MRKFTTAVLITLFAAAPIQMAFAEPIAVPREEFGSVDASQMQDLTEQLREIGVLGEAETLEATGEEAKAGDERALDPVSLIAIFGPMVCKFVVGEQRAKRLASCDKKKSDEAKAQCRTNIDSWSDPVSKLCDLVKLN